MVKGSKLKVRKFWGLIPRFVEVTGEMLNRVKDVEKGLSNKEVAEKYVPKIPYLHGSKIKTKYKTAKCKASSCST